MRRPGNIFSAPGVACKLLLGTVHTNSVLEPRPNPESERPIFYQLIMCCRWQLWLPVIYGYSFLYQPRFLSTPIELGGLRMSLSTIGKILSIYGLLNGFSNPIVRQNPRSLGLRKGFLSWDSVCVPSCRCQ